MKIVISGVELSCVQGDITIQPNMDAIVNAANAQLLTGGGVAGAIHHAAGPGLADECRPMAPIQPGEAVISSGHQLPNSYVIHCLGPVYRVDEPSDKLLADCYRNALQVADEKRLASIAFPAISTGAFGFPIEPAATIALETICQMIPKLKHVNKVRMVLYDQTSLLVHEKKLRNIG